jgi:hypothetical protein
MTGREGLEVIFLYSTREDFVLSIGLGVCLRRT